MVRSFYLLAGLLLAGLVLFGRSGDRPEPPITPAAGAPGAPAPATMPAGNGIASVELQRAPDSHFYADALVNGTPVRFIVDTAATSVVLTQADAQRVGLLGGDFSARGRGAGGEVRLMPITITRLAVGPVGAEQVPAMVAEDGLQVSLLGQTYLQRVGTVTIEGDRMVLR